MNAFCARNLEKNGSATETLWTAQVLENTENALKNNQNLCTDTSRRSLELTNQLIQLKQAVNQANRTGDELR